MAIGWRYGGMTGGVPPASIFAINAGRIFSGRGGAYVGKSEIILGMRVYGRNFWQDRERIAGIFPGD